jgi:hypothetical protein
MDITFRPDGWATLSKDCDFCALGPVLRMSLMVVGDFNRLTSTWQKYSLALAGDLSNVPCAFTWVIRDSGKPATFYLSEITFE